MISHNASQTISNALVTGASGFVGRHLVEELVRLAVVVRVLVRNPNASPWLGHLPVEIVTGDITDPASLHAAVDGIDTVFHLAAVDKPAHLPLADYRRINADGTANVIHACQQAGSIRRFIHASTVAVYGPCPPGVEFSESTAPNPTEKYAVTKLEGEAYAREAKSDFEVVIARLEWIYGPYSSTSKKLFQSIRNKKMVRIGSCQNTHQPIWIGDVVAALLKCATVQTLPGLIYNFAGPRAITVEHEFHTVAAAVGVKLPRVRLPMPLMYWTIRGVEALFKTWGGAPPVNRRQLDFFRISRAHSNERAKHELDWQPVYDFESCARETATWLESTGEIS